MKRTVSMLRGCKYLVGIFSVMVLCFTVNAAGAIDNQTKIESLAKLTDTNWQTRHQGILQLKTAVDDSEVQNSLITLLLHENEAQEEWWRKYLKDPQTASFGSEGYGEYYLDLLQAVVAIKNEKVIPALIGGAHCARIVQQTIADFGAVAGPYLLKTLQDSVSPEVMTGAMNTVMLLSSKISLLEKDRLLFRDLIVAKLTASEPSVRKAAISALAKVGDDSVIPILAPLRDSDPFVIQQPDTPGSAAQFPVREEAAKAIQQLQNKQR